MKCKKGYKKKEGRCIKKNNSSFFIKNKKYNPFKISFIKKNWDILLSFLIPIVGMLIFFIALIKCSGFGCLVWILPVLIGLHVSFIFIIISIFRNLKNKPVSNFRWIFITIYFVIITILTIVYGVEILDPSVWIRSIF